MQKLYSILQAQHHITFLKCFFDQNVKTIEYTYLQGLYFSAELIIYKHFHLLLQDTDQLNEHHKTKWLNICTDASQTHV